MNHPPLRKGSDDLQIATLYGIPIRMNGFVLVILLSFLIMGLGVKICLLFLAILWHELSHGIVAACLGLRVKEVEFLPFGGVVRIEGLSRVGNGGEILISAAGPLASIGLAAFFYVCPPLYGMEESWEFLVQCNGMLAAFNLLPALPLDGGRIARSWLSAYTDYKTATSWIVGSSYFFCILFFTKILYDFFATGTINITMAMAVFFLFLYARRELAIKGFRTMAILTEKKNRFIAAGVFPAVSIVIAKSTQVKNILPLITPDKYFILTVIDERYQICGTVTETELWEGIQENGYSMTIGDFL